MKKLHQKNELLFAIVWIVVYVVLFSVADALSESAPAPKMYTCFLALVMCAVLLLFICKNGLKTYYGLTKPAGNPKQYLYFLPLAVIASCNLWGGLQLTDSFWKLLPSCLSLAFAGLLEELIFRGLLFKAMQKDNQTSAIIVGSITFGMGHIVNLLNGAPLLETLLQIAYATALGYLFIVIFLKSGSILPCIVAHMLINGMSVFGRDLGLTVDIICALILVVLPLGYALWLNRNAANKAA